MFYPIHALLLTRDSLNLKHDIPIKVYYHDLTPYISYNQLRSPTRTM